MLRKINLSNVVEAVKNAKPITMSGKAVVEEMKYAFASEGLTSSRLIALRKLLEVSQADASLENIKKCFDEVLPAAKLNVAYAIEQLEKRNDFFKVSQEGISQLAELFKQSSAMIVDSINAGALDAYKMNPVIAELIALAEQAARDKIQHDLGGKLCTNFSDVQLSLEPIFKIGDIDGDDLVMCDNQYFIIGSRGGVTTLTREDIRQIGEMTSNVIVNLSDALSITQSASQARPYSRIFPTMEQLFSAQGIKSLELDLLAPEGQWLKVNDLTMSYDEFLAMFGDSTDESRAMLAYSSDFKHLFMEFSKALQVLHTFKDSLVINSHFVKFSVIGQDIYVGKIKGRFVCYSSYNFVPTSVNTYTSIYDLLANPVLVQYPNVHRNVSEFYAADIENEDKTLSSKHRLLNELIDERDNLYALRASIMDDIEIIAKTPEFDELKLEAMNVLLSDVNDSIAEVSTSIEKLRL